MPQYPNGNTNKTGKVKATPYPKWREWLPWFPYFVGQKIMFRIYIEENPGMLIHEKFGDTIFDTFSVASGKICRGNVIPRECDVEYFLAFPNERKFIAGNTITLMTTNVTNTDRWSLGCAGLIIGAVITFVITIASGIVLGFIKVEPILRMFITP